MNKEKRENKENKKKDVSLRFMIIVLVIGIVFISGCQYFPFQGGKITNYRIGYNGVVLEPYSSNPDSVYEKDSFQMSVFVKNLGSYNIEPGTPLRMTVTYNNYYMDLNGDISRNEEFTFPLHKRDQYYPLGDMNYSEFFFKAKNLDSLREEIETEITFNMCYPYSTELSISTCIDTKSTTQESSPGACKMAEYRDGQGQGAPVAITRIIPEIVTVDTNNVRPQFRIYFENKGEGYVVDKTQPDVCSDRTILNSSHINEIRVSARLSDRELDCVPSTIRVIDGKENVAKCFVKPGDLVDYGRNTRNYVALLTVRADYGYIQVYNEKLIIKRIDEITQKVERCGPYEVMNSSNECESKCSYCARNNGAGDCTDTNNNRITRGFSCSCSLSTCTSLVATGQCGLGFCPGSNYCCNIDQCWNQADGTQCGANYICLGGKCSTSVNNTATTECWWQYGQYDGNYTCGLDTSCNQTSIVRGLCPGDIHTVCCKPRGR